MKELRLDADNDIWRIAFAFDPKGKAILLVDGEMNSKLNKMEYLVLNIDPICLSLP